MLALRVAIDPAQLQSVKQTLRQHPERFKQALAGAINDTAKHEASAISRRIRESVNLSKDDVDGQIHRTFATPDELVAVVTISKSKRFGLSHFGARMTGKGVTYQIDKQGARKLLPHAFIVNKIGGNVFLRGRKEDETRHGLPIHKKFGISPWGAFVKAGGQAIAESDAQAFLNNRVKHRLLYSFT